MLKLLIEGKSIFTPSNCLLISKRYKRRCYKYRPWPNTWLPFKWERPEDPPGYFNTGDPVEGLPPHDPKEVQPLYKDLPELKEAPEEVKKMFTYRMLRRREIIAAKLEEYQKQYGRYSFDTKSPEVKIIAYTLKIRNLRDIIRNYAPNAAREKDLINNWNGKREKWLNTLFRLNLDRYTAIIKALDIHHTPPDPGDSNRNMIQRKRELRRITAEYIDKIKKEKLDKYHNYLKQEQEIFLKEKADTEKWIAETLEKFNLEDPRKASDGQQSQ